MTVDRAVPCLQIIVGEEIISHFLLLSLNTCCLPTYNLPKEDELCSPVYEAWNDKEFAILQAPDSKTWVPKCSEAKHDRLTSFDRFGFETLSWKRNSKITYIVLCKSVSSWRDHISPFK